MGMESKDTRARVEPNLYELACDGISLTYWTSSIDGRAQLSFARGDRSWVFRDEEIRAVSREIGRLITVTLEASPDLETITLTLVLPQVNLEGSESQIKTVAVLTRHLTSIGGPRLVKGQVLTYEPFELAGVARAVES